MRRLTKELRDQLVNDYDGGLSMEKIASKYGIPESRARKLCREYEKFASLVEALAKVGKEHPELRPNIAEKLYDLGVLSGKSKSKTSP